MNVIALCSCHRWVLRAAAFYGYRSCGRCGERPRVVSVATLDDVTECLHEPPCGARSIPSPSVSGPPRVEPGAQQDQLPGR